MKWTEKKKRYLAVGGGAVICVLLLAAIGLQSSKKPAGEDKMPEESQVETEVVVEPSEAAATEESRETEMVIQPNTAEDNTDQPVDSRPAQTDQTEQSIQPEVTKPAEPEDAVKTDPTKKPDGTKVETPAATEVQDSNTPPADNGAENSGGGLPGFDNVPDGGANQVINGQSDGDINKQVGIMD